jgi:hypothetical protein
VTPRARAAALVMLVLCGTACDTKDGAAAADAATSDGAPSCAELPDAYAAALIEASRCNLDGGRNECQIRVTLNLLCGCQTIVNDDTEVKALSTVWQARSCTAAPEYQMTTCPAGCLQESTRVCAPTDAGGTCQLPAAQP